MGKDAYYFSHDSNARHDIKIKAMVNQYGMTGYGLYWVVIEMLRDTSDYELPLKPYFYQALSSEAQMHADVIEAWLKDCIELYELFDQHDGCFYSHSLKKRMALKEDNRQKRSQAGKKGMQNRWSANKDEQPELDSITNHNNVITKISDVITTDNKERKGKEKKVKEIESKGEDIPDPYSDSQKEMASRLVITWESNGYGSLNPITVDKLLADAEIYSEQWVHDAIVRGNERGKRNYAYMKAILNSWQTSGRDSPKPQQKQQDSSKVLGFTEREYDMSALERKLLGRE